MLTPWVVTYVVPPPSARGQNSQTAASSSATRALMRAALGTAVMAGSPGGGGGGAPSRPPRPFRTGLRATDRQAGLGEAIELHVADGAGDRAGSDGAGVGVELGGAVVEGHGGVRRVHGAEVGVRVPNDLGQEVRVRSVPVVVDGGDVGAARGRLAVTGDGALDTRVEGVACREGGGGGGGSGNRDTGEQNARLAHGRVLFSQVTQCRPGGHPVPRRLRHFINALSSAGAAKNQLLSQKKLESLKRHLEVGARSARKAWSGA